MRFREAPNHAESLIRVVFHLIGVVNVRTMVGREASTAVFVRICQRRVRPSVTRPELAEHAGQQACAVSHRTGHCSAALGRVVVLLQALQVNFGADDERWLPWCESARVACGAVEVVRSIGVSVVWAGAVIHRGVVAERPFVRQCARLVSLAVRVPVSARLRAPRAEWLAESRSRREDTCLIRTLVRLVGTNSGHVRRLRAHHARLARLRRPSRGRGAARLERGKVALVFHLKLWTPPIPLAALAFVERLSSRSVHDERGFKAWRRWRLRGRKRD